MYVYIYIYIQSGSAYPKVSPIHSQLSIMKWAVEFASGEFEAGIFEENLLNSLL